VEKEFYNEAVLVQKLRDGDPFAFEKIFSHYSKRLYQFSFSYLKSDADAEDVVEEVFFKLWQNRKSLKTETSFQSYLFTITLNFIKRHFNKKARSDQYKRDILIGFASGNNHSDSSVVYHDLLEKLELLINQLPEKRKQIFIERKQNEKPVKQIAEEMGISPKTVENQLTHALHFLKAEFEKENFGGMLFFYLFIHP